MDASGRFIDPYGGIDDLSARILRHVSPAFAEDPLRILRVARFMARYPDFQIAPETLAFMQEMVQRGDMAHITPERLRAEYDKALDCPAPARFFQTLRDLHADIALFGQPIHTEGIATAFERLGTRATTLDGAWKFALAFSRADLSAFQTASFCHRLKVPKEYAQHLSAIQHFEPILSVIPHDAHTHWDIFKQADGVRRLPAFLELLTVIETQHPVSFDTTREAAKAASAVRFDPVALESIPPNERATHVNTMREAAFLSAWGQHLSHQPTRHGMR